jgi:hypothetical protein
MRVNLPLLYEQLRAGIRNKVDSLAGRAKPWFVFMTENRDSRVFPKEIKINEERNNRRNSDFPEFGSFLAGSFAGKDMSNVVTQLTRLSIQSATWRHAATHFTPVWGIALMLATRCKSSLNGEEYSRQYFGVFDLSTYWVVEQSEKHFITSVQKWRTAHACNRSVWVRVRRQTAQSFVFDFPHLLATGVAIGTRK